MKQTSVSQVLAQQAALAEFGSYAFDEVDFMKVLLEASRVCAQLLEVPYCKVCRYDPMQDKILIVAGYGWKDGVIGHCESIGERSPARMALLTNKPIIIKNLQEQHEYDVPSVYQDHGIVSSVNVIIRSSASHSIYGVLEVDSPVQHDYDEYDIRFLMGFANVLAERVTTSDTISLLRRALKEKDDLLQQKEILLQDLHHRVRNNLQLVYGMLTDPAPNKLESSIGVISRRVLALAQVYDHLVNTAASPHHIDFGSYLISLCRNLETVFSEHSVTLNCQADALILGLDRASAVGLATNEMLVVRLERQLAINGTIHVELHAEGDNTASLTVRDDSGETYETHDKRHGLGLVRRLAQQLRGSFEIDDTNGLTTKLTFAIKSEIGAIKTR